MTANCSILFRLPSKDYNINIEIKYQSYPEKVLYKMQMFKRKNGKSDNEETKNTPWAYDKRQQTDTINDATEKEDEEN